MSGVLGRVERTAIVLGSLALFGACPWEGIARSLNSVFFTDLNTGWTVGWGEEEGSVAVRDGVRFLGRKQFDRGMRQWARFDFPAGIA